MYLKGQRAAFSRSRMRWTAFTASITPPYLSRGLRSPVSLADSNSSMRRWSASERGTAGRGWPAPGFEDRRVRGGGVVRTGDGDDVNGAAAVTEGFPEGGVGGHPGADPVGLETVPTTRIGIDEGGRGSATGDGEVEGEVAGGRPVCEGTAIDALGKDGGGDSEALEVG